MKNRLFVDYRDEPEDVLAGRKLTEELHHGYREQQRVHVRRGGLQREEKGTSRVFVFIIASIEVNKASFKLFPLAS